MVMSQVPFHVGLSCHIPLSRLKAKSDIISYGICSRFELTRGSIIIPSNSTCMAALSQLNYNNL